jgi:hypothetical protein
MLSKLFRQIVGWVPEDTHTKEQALDFLQTKGIPESQGRAMIDGDYQLFEPQTFVILQQELGLSPTDVVEIKKDIAQALGALNKADKQSLRTRE